MMALMLCCQEIADLSGPAAAGWKKVADKIWLRDDKDLETMFYL